MNEANNPKKLDLDVKLSGKDKAKLLLDLMTKKEIELKDGKVILSIGDEININVKKRGNSVDISFDKPYIYVSVGYFKFLKPKVERLIVEQDKITCVLNGFPDISFDIQ